MTYEESIASGSKWTYGYHGDEEWMAHATRELPKFADGSRNWKQYDLEMFFFLHYAKWPTNVSRDEHWWRAAALRWPTTTNDKGGLVGPFVRDSWSEQVIHAISNYTTVNVMGGAGQGKTKGFVAFGITIWDYYAHTLEGARFQFSSVSEQKLKHAAWAMCQELYTQSKKCSASVGVGHIFPGAMEIKRKGVQYNTKGIIRAVLVSNDSRAAQRIDSLTGAHLPTAQVILTDEAQSSPDALNRAGANLRTHPQFFWEFRSGNPDSPEDYLGKCCEPVKGYDTVDPIKNEDAPLTWESYYNGHKAVVIRFDNDTSPGMKDPVKYWYRPTPQKLEEAYPTAESRKTAEFYRFWKGWHPPGFVEDSVIKWSTITQMGCDRFPEKPNLRDAINFASFDSAPASLDRSALTHLQLIFDGDKRVLNVSEAFILPKLNPDTYYLDAAREILIKCRQWQVASGYFICDDTAKTGLPTILQERGFMARRMIYHERPTDRVLDPAIRKKASEHCGNAITEAALILEAYIRYGQVRGLNDTLCPKFREEVCSRRMIQTPGGKQQLEPKATREGKKGFRDRMGFSPDIFDTLCQGAFFAREYLGFQPMSIDLPPPEVVSNKPKLKSLFTTRKFLAHA